MALARALYFDTSALVKLAVNEPESRSLEEFLAGTESQPASSEIAEVEFVRTIRRRAPEFLDDSLQVLAALISLLVNTSTKLRAQGLPPAQLRTLDAIHLATALEIQPDLEAMVSYDNRLIDASREAGLDVISPGAGA